MTNIAHLNGTLESWNLHFEWRAGSHAGSYTPVAGTTCRNFTTGSSGRFITAYSDVVALPGCGVAQGGLSYVQDVTVALSHGTTLPYQVKSLDASNKC